MKILAITAGVLVVIGLIGYSIFAGSYNKLTQQSIAVDTAWANVQTQYQRRFDLVPNLVNATKGALGQEQKVFGEIAQARTQYAGAKTPNDQTTALNGYDSAISRLLVVMENYPQLKSLDNIRNLTDELAGTENRIQIARDRYNAQVSVYNAMIRSFPMNLLAGMYGFQARVFFQPDQGSASAPVVNLQ